MATRSPTSPARPRVTHYSADSFVAGFRPYLCYRDLGVAEETNGRFTALTLRAAYPFRGGTGRHRHVLDFQLVYVLQGTLTFWIDGEGEVQLNVGSSLYLPSEHRHELLAATADAEWIEITSPAEISTVDD